MRRFIALAALACGLATPVAATAEQVAIQSWQNRQYACFDGGYLAASCPGNRAHVFEIERLGGNEVAFRDPASGRYLRAGVTENALMALGGDRIGGWERFEMTQSGGTFHLRSVQNGQYVRAGIGQQTLFGAVSPHTLGWEAFRIFPVGTPSEVSLEQDHETPVQFSGNWVLDRVLDASGQEVRFNDRMARMRPVEIDAQGRLHFTFGCNQINGQLLQRGDRIGVAGGGFMTTRMACPGPEMELERIVSASFASAAHFAINGTRWSLRDANHQLRLEFVRQ